MVGGLRFSRTTRVRARVRKLLDFGWGGFG